MIPLSHGERDLLKGRGLHVECRRVLGREQSPRVVVGEQLLDDGANDETLVACVHGREDGSRPLVDTASQRGKRRFVNRAHELFDARVRNPLGVEGRRADRTVCRIRLVDRELRHAERAVLDADAHGDGKAAAVDADPDRIVRRVGGSCRHEAREDPKHAWRRSLRGPSAKTNTFARSR